MVNDNKYEKLDIWKESIILTFLNSAEVKDEKYKKKLKSPIAGSAQQHLVKSCVVSTR